MTCHTLGLALCHALWPPVPQGGAFVVRLGWPCGGECNPTTCSFSTCTFGYFAWPPTTEDPTTVREYGVVDEMSEARSHGIYMQSRSGHEWHGFTMGWYMVYMSVHDKRGLIEIKAEIKGWRSKSKMSKVRKCTWGGWRDLEVRRCMSSG